MFQKIPPYLPYFSIARYANTTDFWLPYWTALREGMTVASVYNSNNIFIHTLTHFHISYETYSLLRNSKNVR